MLVLSNIAFMLPGYIVVYAVNSSNFQLPEDQILFALQNQSKISSYYQDFSSNYLQQVLFL